MEICSDDFFFKLVGKPSMLGLKCAIDHSEPLQFYTHPHYHHPTTLSLISHLVNADDNSINWGIPWQSSG